MVFTAANLYNVHGMPPGKAKYVYTSDTDDREEIMASGYFNNIDDNQNLAPNDYIEVRGAEGGYTLRVDTVDASTGVVTTELSGQPIWIGPVTIADLAAVTSAWAVAPTDGVIRRMKSVTYGAVDVNTTLGLELAGVNVTDGASADIITIASAGAAGDIDEGEADAANAVTEGQAIEVTCGGEGATVTQGDVYIEILPA